MGLRGPQVSLRLVDLLLRIFHCALQLGDLGLGMAKVWRKLCTYIKKCIYINAYGASSSYVCSILVREGSLRYVCMMRVYDTCV